MNKHVQIREIPEAVHTQLKLRATAEGLSMSDYIKRLIERDLAKPGWDELEKRMENMRAQALKESTAEMVRRERDRH